MQTKQRLFQQNGADIINYYEEYLQNIASLKNLPNKLKRKLDLANQEYSASLKKLDAEQRMLVKELDTKKRYSIGEYQTLQHDLYDVAVKIPQNKRPSGNINCGKLVDLIKNQESISLQIRRAIHKYKDELTKEHEAKVAAEEALKKRKEALLEEQRREAERLKKEEEERKMREAEEKLKEMVRQRMIAEELAKKRKKRIIIISFSIAAVVAIIIILLLLFIN